MVGAARVRNRDRAGAHVAEGHQPLSEKIPEAAIALQVNTANFSGAVIEIEIARKLFIVRQGRQLRRRSIRVTASATTAELSRASFERSKVGLHVSARAQQSFFFTGPECDANRASRFDSECLQNANCFHRYGHARAVVGCAGPRMP